MSNSPKPRTDGPCALWVAVPLLILWLLWDYRHDWRTIVVYFLIYGMAGAGYEFENDHGKRRRLITAEENARLSEDEQRVIASLKADIPKVIAASSPESVAHLRAIAAEICRPFASDCRGPQSGPHIGFRVQGSQGPKRCNHRSESAASSIRRARWAVVSALNACPPMYSAACVPCRGCLIMGTVTTAVSMPQGSRVVFDTIL